MWEIDLDKDLCADKNLASISVDIPTNTQNDAGFGVLVGVWCAIDHFTFENDGRKTKIQYGLLAGEITVDVDDGKISNLGRLQKEAYRIQIARTTKDDNEKSAKLGAGFANSILDILKSLGISIETGGNINKTVSVTEQKGSEYYQVFWRLADASRNLWRIYGIGLNDYGVLENKIIGDEPLCYISADKDAHIVKLRISFGSDLRDLWLESSEEEPSHFFDKRFKRENDKRNRELIATVLAGKALNRASKKLNPHEVEGRILLARQHLTARRA